MKIKNFLREFDYKAFLIRILLLAILLGIAFIPIYFLFTSVDASLWDALTSGDNKKIVEAVEHYDNYTGTIIMGVLQIVQDWSIVIPSAPVHIAAGIVLGTWKGFIVTHIADVLSNMIVFIVYRKIKKYIDKIIPIKESSSTVKMIKGGRNPAYMVVLACLLPAVPNGFIPYAAVNCDMKLRDYTIAVIIGAAPPKIVLTALGDRIFDGNWLLMLFLVLFALVAASLLVKYQAPVYDFFTQKFKKNKKVL